MKFRLHMTVVILMLVAAISVTVCQKMTAGAHECTFLIPMLVYVVLELLVPEKMHYLHTLLVFVFPVVYFRPGQERIISLYYVVFLATLFLSWFASTLIQGQKEMNES